MSEVESLIREYWPALLEVYISPLSQPGEIKGWQVELLLMAPSPRCPNPNDNTKSFQAETVELALRQARDWMEY